MFVFDIVNTAAAQSVANIFRKYKMPTLSPGLQTQPMNLRVFCET